MQEYEALLYFVSGVFNYEILAQVFNLGKSYEIYNETVKNCMGMMKITDETRKMSQEVKYLLLKEGGMPDLEIDSVKRQDEEMSELWKKIAISALMAMLPKYVKKNLIFKDWDSAMNIVEKEIK